MVKDTAKKSNKVKTTPKKITKRETLPDKFNTLLECITQGYSVFKACKENNINPADFWAYIDTNTERKEEYTRARNNRGDVCIDRIEEYENKLKAGTLDAQTARVLIDTEKWKAAKFYPKMYGEKSSVEVSGKDGAPLSAPIINILPVETKGDNNGGDKS